MRRIFDPFAPLQYWAVFVLGANALAAVLLVDVRPYPNRERDTLIAAAVLGMPTLAFLLLAIWATRRKRNTDKRRRLGLCSCCGYDLRASDGRCPECGTTIKAIATGQHEGF